LGKAEFERIEVHRVGAYRIRDAADGDEEEEKDENKEETSSV
jgi:hypothetical protein